MSTEFSTSHGDQVIAAVQKQYPGVSIRPGKEISLDDHAKFRYDIPSEGYVRLDWHDQEFEDAWSFWIKRYAPAFLENRGQEPVKKLTRRCAKDLGGENSHLSALQAIFATLGYLSGHPGNRQNQFFHRFQPGVSDVSSACPLFIFMTRFQPASPSALRNSLGLTASGHSRLQF